MADKTINDMDFNVRQIRAKVNTIESNVYLIESDVSYIKNWGVECN